MSGEASNLLRSPMNGAVVGLVVGVVTIWLLTIAGVEIPLEKMPTSTIRTSDAAAYQFVDAWKRMRSSTWAVDSTFTRRADDGKQISADVHEAQKPPDRVRQSFGSSDIQLNGHDYACSSSQLSPDLSGIRGTCRDNGLAPSFDLQVDDEVTQLRSQVAGAQKLYDVAAEIGDCFTLYQHPGRQATAWGSRARFCFDPTTGAPLSSEFDRSGVVDTTRVVALRSQPKPEELRLPSS